MPRLPCLTPWARSGLRHSWTVPQSASGAEKAAQHPSGLGGPLREKMAGTEGVTVNIFRRGLPKRDGASLLEYQSQAVCQRSPGKGTTSEIRSHNSALSCSRSIVAAARYPQRSPCAWAGFEARDRPRLLGTL